MFWILGSKDDVTIDSNIPFITFTKVVADGYDVPEANYTKSGDNYGTTITLKADWLKGLAAGAHPVRLVSDLGTTPEATLMLTNAFTITSISTTYWHSGKGNEGVTIRTTIPVSLLTEVLIDGKPITVNKDYDRSGDVNGTTVTLKSSYLSTLPKGVHLIKLNSKLGATQNGTSITIVDQPRITSGANATWNRGSSGGVKINTNIPVNDITKIVADGYDLPADKYVKTGITNGTSITLKDDYLAGLANGKHPISIVTKWGEATTSFTVAGNAPAEKHAMYRLYNPNSGEHFYTSSAYERDVVSAAGWKYEGIGWYAPSGGHKVFRLYNANGGEHHYTMSTTERDVLIKAGWSLEEGGWYSDMNEALPLYRVYNPNAFANNHHYTVNKAERDMLIKKGWKNEGIAWHGLK